MEKIRIITDSASDLSASTREDLTILPLAIRFGDTEYLDGVTISHHEFYEKLIESDTLPTTSLVSPAAFEEVYARAVADGETVIAITISGRLSGTYQSATIAAEDFAGKVFVIDSYNATIGEGILVRYALLLKDQGLSAKEIVGILEASKEQIHTLGVLDTLEYLKKGGRITPAAAMIGTVLNIKPVLTIQGEKLDAFEKARGVKQAKKAMIKAMKKDMDKRFAKERAAGIMGLHIAYTANDKEVIDGWIAEVKEAFPDFEVDAHPLSLSVACHIGPGALAIACEKKSAIS